MDILELKKSKICWFCYQHSKMIWNSEKHSVFTATTRDFPEWFVSVVKDDEDCSLPVLYMPSITSVLFFLVWEYNENISGNRRVFKPQPSKTYVMFLDIQEGTGCTSTFFWICRKFSVWERNVSNTSAGGRRNVHAHLSPAESYIVLQYVMEEVAPSHPKLLTWSIECNGEEAFGHSGVLY